ncbi:c-type cytochrome [Salinicola halophilus]|uniref:c-type cytochrome n=1 Tax=Salinicola halophilus TaxID=184065 RepID=UPI0019550305|nr:c-type cytochrome [Salinicola halophilus]
MTKMGSAFVAATLMLLSAGAPALAVDGKTVFESDCAGCHQGGGAPAIGDRDAWASRLDAGMETLYANAIDGVGGMPAKGGNADLSDDAVRAAVDYIVEESR